MRSTVGSTRRRHTVSAETGHRRVALRSGRDRPRPCRAAHDEPQWCELYAGYRTFYGLPDDPAAVHTTWQWVSGRAHGLLGLVAEDADGRLSGSPTSDGSPGRRRRPPGCTSTTSSRAPDPATGASRRPSCTRPRRSLPARARASSAGSPPRTTRRACGVRPRRRRDAVGHLRHAPVGGLTPRRTGGAWRPRTAPPVRRVRTVGPGRPRSGSRPPAGHERRAPVRSRGPTPSVLTRRSPERAPRRLHADRGRRSVQPIDTAVQETGGSSMVIVSPSRRTVSFVRSATRSRFPECR